MLPNRTCILRLKKVNKPFVLRFQMENEYFNWKKWKNHLFYLCKLLALCMELMLFDFCYKTQAKIKRSSRSRGGWLKKPLTLMCVFLCILSSEIDIRTLRGGASVREKFKVLKVLRKKRSLKKKAYGQILRTWFWMFFHFLQFFPIFSPKKIQFLFPKSFFHGCPFQSIDRPGPAQE